MTTKLILLFISFLLVEVFLRFTFEDSGPLNNLQVIQNRRWINLPPNGIPKIPNSFSKFVQYDNLMGWSLKPLSSSQDRYFINSQGFRINKDQFKRGNYLKDKIDILTIGCSMTEGYDVDNEYSWPFLLEKKTGFCVANIGTRGYGLDQMILSYIKNTSEFNKVILGIIPDSFDRSTKIVRHGVKSNGWQSKPLFKHNKKTGSFEFINIPPLKGIELQKEYILRERSNFLSLEYDFHPWILKEHNLDIFYTFRFFKIFPIQMIYTKDRIYQNKIKENDLVYELFKYFKQILDERDHESLVLLMGPGDLTSQTYLNQWKETKSMLENLNLNYLDLTKLLHSETYDNKSKIYLDIGGHYTEYGNDLVADKVSKVILQN